MSDAIISTVGVIVSAVAWPLTVAGLVVGFRPQLGVLLERLVSAKLPGGTEVLFGRSQADQQAAKANLLEKDTPETRIDLQKVGNLYWLGHDVMWSIDVLLRGGQRADILHGLRQSKHHATEIGLSVWAERLGNLYRAVTETRESELTIARRDQISGELRRISDQIGAIAEANQGGFRSSP